jgi:hypothetical protein
MKILYMNQGGGEWGAIKYKDYDIILLAESDNLKPGFSSLWTSTNIPVMSVQTATAQGRIASSPSDIDRTYSSTRPIVTFTTAHLKPETIRVVFVHLKSADDRMANNELALAIRSIARFPSLPTLWIGDFNRASDALMGFAHLLYQGGGAARWNLDRAYASGDWASHDITAKNEATSSDNLHEAISFSYK